MTQITVIGLGYVGLPLAVLFASKYKVIGYDTNPKRVGELLLMTDSTGETDSKSLLLCRRPLTPTTDPTSRPSLPQAGQ